MSFERILPDSDTECLEKLSEIASFTFTDTFRHYKAEDIEHYLKTSLSTEALGRELEDSSNYFYFVNRNEERTGYLKWIYPSTTYLEHADLKCKRPLLLERFYFLPEFCGTGLAPLALQFVTSFAHHHARSDFLYLSVWEKNYRAQRFYQKHGFRTYCSFDYPVGEEVDQEFLYGKRLP